MIVDSDKRRLPKGIISDEEWPLLIFNKEKIKNFYERYFNSELDEVDKISQKDIVFKYGVFMD